MSLPIASVVRCDAADFHFVARETRPCSAYQDECCRSLLRILLFDYNEATIMRNRGTKVASAAPSSNRMARTAGPRVW